ncbi:Holliday junction branch migration protein RuvA [Candidatus Falkowbacteria bacterium]|nr:Holliday junction branch migration protein RuvA [Candidatus Falkowbacteria bacterium]
MIGYLNGTVIDCTAKTLLLDVGGVGYTVFTTGNVLRATQAGDQLTLYIHTHVREDALELYGLPSPEAVDFFKQLISVTGVGPKSALAIFEIADLQELKTSIASSDTSLLTKVSGIGKKIAEMIVIKLRDKSLTLADLGHKHHPQSQAIDALVSLGYSLADAREALSQIDAKHQSTEDRVKAALKLLAKQ